MTWKLIISYHMFFNFSSFMIMSLGNHSNQLVLNLIFYVLVLSIILLLDFMIVACFYLEIILNKN